MLKTELAALADSAIFARIATIVRRPTTRRWGIRLAIAFVVIGITGFLIVPPILKYVLVSQLEAALKREVIIESVSVNPYTLTASLQGVSIRSVGTPEGEPAGEELLGFDSLRVNAELASIAVAGVVIKEVELVGPRVHIVRYEGTRYNFSDLLEPKPEEASSAQHPSTGLPRFSVSNIRITGGQFIFDDRPEETIHKLQDVKLAIPFVSTLSYYSDTYVEPHFSAIFNGAPIALSGKTRPFVDSRESEFALNLDDLQLAPYLAYSPFPLPIKVISGTLDTKLSMRFLESQGKPATILLAGSLALKDINIEESSGAPLFSMKALALDLEDIDLVNRSLMISRLSIESPEINARISRNGTLNWLGLIPATPPKKEASPPFRVQLAQAGIKDGSLNVHDQSTGVEQKGSIRNIELSLSNFDTTHAKPLGFKASWSIDAGERLQVKRVELQDGEIRLDKHQVRIGQYTLTGTRANMVRNRDGELAWFKAPLMRAVAAAAKDKEIPWQIAVDSASITDQQMVFEDRTLTSPMRQTLEIDTLQIDDFSTHPDTDKPSQLAAHLRINKKGDIELKGTITPTPSLPEAEISIKLRDIELLPFQPYVSELLNISVTRGQLAATGNVSLAKKGESLGATYKGSITLANFLSVDKANSADFLKWKSLHLGNIDLKTQPAAVSVGEVALSDFYVRAILSADRQLNLLNIVHNKNAPSAKTTAPPTQTAPPSAMDDEKSTPGNPNPATESRHASSTIAENTAGNTVSATTKSAIPLQIGKVTLQGGTINFTDHFIKPNFSANLTKIGGRISGLSSAEGSVADLELRGRYNDLAPVTILAKLNPLTQKTYLDLNAEVKGLEMTTLSSYSSKYAGYAIERGKLSLFLNYKINDNKLVAENRIILDQLTFGDETHAEGASKLPVRLAVSLLQNRKGEIDINLPISGSLDDPEFSVGGIVVQVIVNVIGKAITAPFALLGSLFGGGEELAYVEFDYGYATLSDPAKERLRTLAKVLEERPSFRIDLAGRIDPEQDREGLKKALMEQRIKAQRLNELVKAGQEAGSLDDIVISPKDYPKYLERAYKAESFPKPRNIIGIAKDLPVEEMEKLMLANMKADEEALHDLAERRAQVIGSWLVNEGKIPAERVFERQPNMQPKEGPQQEKARDARVDFLLK